ncbi:hypothetical protein [Desulfogranum japonicum]|uniref:hypothetical protein n=1 Tax=Desulfogranum japonicum TaxID=231447 RepID=UPI0004916189|nr:hypothetical protein [Desulfogranum japonicum]
MKYYKYWDELLDIYRQTTRVNIMRCNDDIIFFYVSFSIYLVVCLLVLFLCILNQKVFYVVLPVIPIAATRISNMLSRRIIGYYDVGFNFFGQNRGEAAVRYHFFKKLYEKNELLHKIDLKKMIQWIEVNEKKKDSNRLKESSMFKIFVPALFGIFANIFIYKHNIDNVNFNQFNIYVINFFIFVTVLLVIWVFYNAFD